MTNKPVLLKKERHKLEYRSTKCANCEHPLRLSDKYCPNCSQQNSIKKLTLRDFFDEFFATIISYDSKLLQTLSALLTRPGKITRDYINGKRVTYTNPFRFLLSLAIIYFLIINYTGNFENFNKYGEDQKNSLFKQDNPLFSNFNKEVEKINQKNDSLKTDLPAVPLDSIIASINKKDAAILAEPQTYFKSLENHSLSIRFFKKREFFNLILATDKIYDFDEIPAKYQIEETRENVAAFRAASSMMKFKKQPGNYLTSTISKLPFVIFFFLPVFTLFIFLIYIRKNNTYTEHLIFSFHNQSLLFTLLIISFLIDTIFSVNSFFYFILIFGVYLFISIWKFYQQGLFKTIIKFIFLNIVFFMLGMFATLLLFIGGLFIY